MLTIFLRFMCVCVCVCYMCIGALGDSLMEMLGTELSSSGRAANISNHRTISSPLQIFN